MARETRSRTAKTAAAFTLVELLLAVVLVLLLAGAVIINFGSLEGNARLEEGASHLETLFRYARAEAASTGRQVRIVFGPDLQSSASAGASTNLTVASGSTNSGVQVLWEPDPVNAPGIFQTLVGAQLLVDQVNDLVKVQEVRQPGANLPTATGFALASTLSVSFQDNATNAPPPSDTSTNAIPPLTCYPDGSSDSAEVVLVSANTDDKRLAIVTLSGLTGVSKHRLTTPSDDAAPASNVVAQSQSVSGVGQ